MKTITSLLTLVLLCVGLSVYAQNSVTITNYVIITNTMDVNTNGMTVITGDGVNTNTSAPDSTSWELTVGGGGFSDLKTRNHQFGLDVSVDVNPFTWNRSVWVGVEQDLSIQSDFTGFSDVFVEYAFDIYKGKLYLNPGADIRATYASDSVPVFSTGPHVSLQYFFFDNAFSYIQANYLFQTRGDNQFLYSVGLGFWFP